MPNAILYVLPNENTSYNFDANGDYTFACAGESNDVNHSVMTPFPVGPIPWASSDVQIDNALKDGMIETWLSQFNVTLTRADIRIFR